MKVFASSSFQDNLGTLVKTFSSSFMQEPFSLYDSYVAKSSFNVFRGLHRQESPHGQTKIFSVVEGAVVICALDYLDNSKPVLQLLKLNAGSSHDGPKSCLINGDLFTGYYVLSQIAYVSTLSGSAYVAAEEQVVNPEFVFKHLNIDERNTPFLSEKDRSGLLINTSNIEIHWNSMV